jgi:hypothetical protein
LELADVINGRRNEELLMKTTKVHDELIDFIADCNPRSVSQFDPSEEAKARVWDLVAKSKTHSLTEDEAAELDSYRQLEHLMRMAKARALQRLAARKN